VSDLRKQLQDAEASLAAQAGRNAEAEARWKEEQAGWAEAEAHLKAEAEQRLMSRTDPPAADLEQALRDSGVEEGVMGRLISAIRGEVHKQLQDVETRLMAQAGRHAEAEARWKEEQAGWAEAEAHLKAEAEQRLMSRTDPPAADLEQALRDSEVEEGVMGG
jgi:hypothetical protein